MDPMEPVYSAGVLLVIAAVAVAVLLFLIIKLRMHAFVALILVSLLTAIAAGIPMADVATVAISFFGSTLGSVALLVGLGAMIGRLLEVTGGAQVLADTLIGRFGEKRAPFALGVAALLFGLPIFFDAGLVVFLPIIFSVARRFGGSVLLYAIPAAGAFAAMPFLRHGRQDDPAYVDADGDRPRAGHLPDFCAAVGRRAMMARRETDLGPS